MSAPAGSPRPARPIWLVTVAVAVSVPVSVAMTMTGVDLGAGNGQQRQDKEGTQPDRRCDEGVTEAVDRDPSDW